MKFAFYTLGCKTNQYETQAMERLLLDLGHTLGRFDEDCDGYVINTCSVTAVADKKNRAVIRRCRREHPDAVIGVGPIRAAPLELAVEQAKALSARGYREIVVTGIEIASWGADLPGKPEVTGLIEAICQAVPEMRVRLGSLEPRIVTEDFCQRLSRFPNLCPQFHLSMQSGCDTVLERMRRKYDTKRYYESVCLLKTHFPGCSITTDMIVAFPGETEEEFQTSLAFIRKCGFADMHIFPYSRRPGTPAAIAVAAQMSLAYRQALVGSVQQVLFEETDEGYFTGHAPNYVKVYAAGEDLHNQVRNVRIDSIYREGVLGTIVE